jgi:hypothetical protein
MAALLLLAGLLAHPAAAGADYDPLGGGATRLVLDKRFAAFLAHERISVKALAGAERRGRVLVLPVSGGSIDPTIGRGEVENGGTIVLQSSRRRLPFRELVVKTTHSPLVAKVGGSQLKVATSRRTASARSGFGTIFRAEQLKLTAKAATRLNKKLRPRHPFGAGQTIGTLVSRPQPLVTAILPVGRATLVFDAAFMAKLEAHFVSVNPIFPAEHVGGTFTLPIIARGALATNAALGTLRTGGEIEFLQLGAGQVFWHELWFDLGSHATVAEADVEPAPPFPGKLGQVPVLDLGVGAASADPGQRTIGFSGAPLTLPASTAAAFNQAFAAGREDFHPGELLGTISFTAQGQ